MRQTEVKVKGKAYKLQSIPFKSYMDITDKHTDKNGNLKKSGYIEDLLKHCVIEPKVTMSAFDDDFGAAMELTNKIESFLTGVENAETIPGESAE
ncbi:MAG TPA: hypothetical protein DDZ44_00405 [Syntrophomonas wolfei]|jgi:hypothetical protein|uniref:Phage protein n=1 Tax=Syntrophomonas wolfei TaxID=863 RepID=A0A354YSU3_9FIRM|nr:hypothetical protein [Syntrophomonas wolfei]HBQ85286.1 hypothetical protein [Syntrophomonas sp.]